MENKKDVSIQVIRIISMFFILLCHFFNEIGNGLSSLGQFFNVGVFIFFIISAYLYGKKEIKEPVKWLKRKFIQICLPVYIWIAIVNIIYLITKTDVNWFNNLGYLLNVQAFVNMPLTGLQHLWFVSMILILYLFTPILSKLKYNTDKKYIYFIFMMSITVIYIQSLLFFSSYSRYFLYLLLYTFIYRFNYLLDYKYNRYVLSGIFIINCIIRVAFKFLIDETILYDNVVVLITQSIIAVCIFLFVKSFIFSENKLINIIDDISYYVYIVHYIFCVGPIKIIEKFSIYYILEVFITVLISFGLSIVLKNICERVKRFCYR